MSEFSYKKDQDGIVTVTMNMSGSVNAMNEEYYHLMHDTVEKLKAETDIIGVVLASAKKVFFAGGDLNDLVKVESSVEAANKFMEHGVRIKHDLRALEQLSVPVVAAINGAALGGGYEICLACNHRVAFNHKSVKVGLPEVTLGLLPGGGGVVRLTNLLGLQVALPLLVEGKQLVPEKALQIGMIDEVVDSIEQLVPVAKDWIKKNRVNVDAASNPWDRKGFRIPGGAINSPKNIQLAMIAPTMLLQKTKGLLPAPIAIMDIAFQASMLDFDTAQRIESRGLTKLVQTPEAKNMITAFFFQMNKIKGGIGRPKTIPQSSVKKIGIVGAGMMGQGIAYSCAMAGMQVVLKDISMEAAEQGKAYTEKLLKKNIERGRLDKNKAEQTLSLIQTVTDNNALQNSDLIIEAVFENFELKNKTTREIEKYLASNGIWGSNTSTLPITRLAEASSNKPNFIGIHFFSPVDKMPLIEIICGKHTSDETLAKTFDFVTQIGKIPIVVNDSLGFFTSRTFSTYIDEGLRLLDEGVHPVTIDNLGKGIGMPVGPLAVQDETSLELGRKAQQTWDEMGLNPEWGDQSVSRKMIEIMIGGHGRGGRHHGGGFYEYYSDGSKEIWSKLYDMFYKPEVNITETDIKDRLLFRPVIESLKCLETGVLRTVAEGNIGSIMGIGAPVHTGGYIQFVNTYGLERFIIRCDELATNYGERFKAPSIVQQKLMNDELFV